MEIDWKNLIESAEKVTHVSEEQSKPYCRQYPSIIRFVSSLPEFDHDNLRVISLAVYGWMPRMLSRSDQEAEVTSLYALNQYKNGRNILNSEINCFSRLMNNSYVGASKLLHFVAPSEFPIWDSRVARALDVKQHNTLIKFQEYKQAMQNFPQQQLLKRAISLSSRLHSGYSVTPIRALEHCLFLAGSRISNSLTD